MGVSGKGSQTNYVENAFVRNPDLNLIVLTIFRSHLASGAARRETGQNDAPCLRSIRSFFFCLHVTLLATAALSIIGLYMRVFAQLLLSQHHQHNWAFVSHFWSPQSDGCWSLLRVVSNRKLRPKQAP